MSPIWLFVAVLALLAASAAAFYLFRLLSAQHGAEKTLAERTATVNRLLEFSQSIQGAGKQDQIFATLSHFLRNELSLSGLAILVNEPENIPATQLAQSWPANLVASSALIDFDAALCPCMRQSLPRTFGVEGAPIRCAIDSGLKLPATHPAHCIPFSVGRKAQAVIHMLLPPAQQWTESRRQIAQTYVNTAHSALTNLNLLAEAEKQSSTDPLTGLYNRRSMSQMLEREVALAERHSHALSIVMIDLDHFKQINDKHGHAAGDHMLKAFADCVNITLRKTDLAFRYGGDEFVIALPQTPLYQAQQVVQKLRQAFLSVDFSHAITQLDQHPTLSIGVAERSKATNILTLSNLLGAADQALYSAKNSTRNCVRVYEPPQQAA
jgi:diguanylate cyclase (GGDEF)-like protein